MTLRLAVLGDSIAFGQGAARPEDRPAALFTRGLAASDIEVTARVFAVPGARSAGLAAQVERAVSWRPELAVVVIGANDLTHRVPVRTAAQALGEAVRRLREHGAEVLVAPAPDLSIVPQVPRAARSLVRAGSLWLRQAQARAVRDAGGHVADHGDTTESFAADPAMHFSADSFHPSSAGYQVIAGALLPDLVALARDLTGVSGDGTRPPGTPRAPGRRS